MRVDLLPAQDLARNTFAPSVAKLHDISFTSTPLIHITFGGRLTYIASEDIAVRFCEHSSDLTRLPVGSLSLHQKALC